MSESAVLAGTPRSISGFVPFRNTSDQAITIDQVTVDDADSSVTLVVPVTQTVFEPGRRGRIELRMQFPPHTRPGAYPLDITVADTTVPAVAHVAEDHDVGLSPQLIVVPNHPGATVTTTVVIANEGNVDVQLARLDDVPVYREDQARSTLATLATTRILDGAATVEPLPDAPSSSLGVAPAQGPQVVAPGETRAVEFEISVPEDLSRCRRWLAGFPIALRTAVVALIPGDEQTKEPS